MTTNDGTVGRYLGWFLVALALGSGVIHFAVAGGHFDLSWSHGMFFAVVAWLQLCWAAAIIVRPPSQRMLAAGIIGNAAVIGTWAMSRLWGVPVGPEAWEPEPVSLADALATGFEAGIVALSLVVLFKPALASRPLKPRLGLAGIGTTGVAIAVVSTVALSPSFASDHHGESGGHDDHGDEAADGHADEEHEGHTNYMIMADGTSACEQGSYANEGNSGHGHRGPVPFEPMDDATREKFKEQVRQSNEAIARFPTVKDAEAAGYTGITPYVPCIAAHYIKYSALGNGFDPAEPEIILYMGNDPDDEVVGLSYLSFVEDPDVPPEGFAGDNDPWHIHESLCIGGGGRIQGDESTGDEDCEARGGKNVDLGNLFMNHMWNVAGWESRWGLFSSEHPDLGGDIGNPVTVSE